MAIHNIVTLHNQNLLREKSAPVSLIDADIRKLIEEMFETMYAAPGIGLAAIQIGIRKRIITLDISKNEASPERHVLINAKITLSSVETEAREEGCLSIPEYYEEVKRAARIKVKYLDHHGKDREMEADGLLARCMQHEIDHNNGVLFIDHISRLKRNLVLKKFAKASRISVKKVRA
jgi:peptide deformylase